MSRLSGKVIALTGAGSGIGRALALDLARRGAKLALADKDAQGLAQTVQMLGNYPVYAADFDVTQAGRLADWVAQAVREFGRLDGIINNAGLSVTAPFADCPKADFDRVMDVNFNAVVEGCRVALPHVKAAAKADGAGWIVNISSVFGMIGFPTQSAYNASKFAVRGFSEALHIELAHTDPHIHVIRVHPGGVKTNVARNAKYIVGLDPADADTDPVASFEANARSTPEQAAATILAGMEKGQHRVLIGPDARVVDWVSRLVPIRYWDVIGRMLK